MLPPALPRVEATISHHEFVAAAEPECVMINLVHARQIVKRGEDSETYFPADTDVVVTSTVDDTSLHLMPWERELEIVREFSPDYHIPTDQPVYEDQSPETRRENIEKMVRGARWMDSRTEFPVVPLVKGLTTEERRICYRLLERLGTDTAAFYAAQYFNSGGNYITELEDDIEAILSERDLDLAIIGLLSPNYVSRMPDGVVSVAGQKQWRDRVAPTKQSDEEVAAAWAGLRDDVRGAIDD